MMYILTDRQACLPVKLSMTEHLSLVVSLAEIVEGPPSLHRGHDEGCDAHESDEAAGGLGSPLLHHKALLSSSSSSSSGCVLLAPPPLREKKTSPLEVVAVFRQRHNRDEAEQKRKEIQDALAKKEIIQGHGSLETLTKRRAGRTAAAH